MVSTTRPTEAAWRWEGRSTSVRVCRPSSRGCSAKRLFWHLKAWNTPLKYLRSRILARHLHAMLKRGGTLVSVYLEPGLRASGLNLWLLEVLAACILCFDGPWIAMGDWNMEPKDLAQAGWLDTVQRQGRCHLGCYLCRGEQEPSSITSCSPKRWRTWCNRSRWLTNSPTTRHSPVRLTIMATSWGHRVLARKRPNRSPRRRQWDPRRQEEKFEWTWAAEETPTDLEMAWLEWLRAAAAAWCRIHDL